MREEDGERESRDTAVAYYSEQHQGERGAWQQKLDEKERRQVKATAVHDYFHVNA